MHMLSMSKPPFLQLVIVWVVNWSVTRLFLWVVEYKETDEWNVVGIRTVVDVEVSLVVSDLVIVVVVDVDVVVVAVVVFVGELLVVVVLKSFW